MKKCLIIDPWSQESQNITEEKENRESNNEVYSISFEGFREVLFGTSVDCPGNSESHDCNHSSEHRYVDEVFYDAGKNLLESRESFYDLAFILSCFECFTGGIGLIDRLGFGRDRSGIFERLRMRIFSLCSNSKIRQNSAQKSRKSQRFRRKK